MAISKTATWNYGDSNDYINESGDTLSKIAQQFYEDASQYAKIVNANREAIKGANPIFLGQKSRVRA